MAQLAVHDWIVLAYLALTFVLVSLGRNVSEKWPTAMLLVGIDLAWFSVALWVGRAPSTSSRPRSRAARAFYRLSLVGIVVATYVQLRWILAVIAPSSVDPQLLAFDLRVFGFEPALAWDAFVSPHTTEWFAFFYFGYFYLLAGHVFPITLGERDSRALSEFALGILTVYCVGQSLYVIVPAIGPHYFCAGSFERPLEGSMWWPLVRDTVASAGAGKDVFPSLHAAAPTFIAIHSFRQRRRTPFRYTWIPVSLFASQVVLATMFLRWHYLIDVIAGVGLACAVSIVVPYVVELERKRRERLGLPPVFDGSIMAGLFDRPKVTAETKAT